MNDTIQKGIIAGLIGSVGDAAIHWPAYFIIGTSPTAFYISELIFPFKDLTLPRILIGMLVHIGAGALVGVGLALIIKSFGIDYPYYKGIGVGFLLWIIHVAVIPNLVAPRPYLFRTTTEAIVDLTAHIVYGSLAAFFLVRSYNKAGYN